jgi:hypothetical protein
VNAGHLEIILDWFKPEPAPASLPPYNLMASEIDAKRRRPRAVVHDCHFVSDYSAGVLSKAIGKGGLSQTSSRAGAEVIGILSQVSLSQTLLAVNSCCSLQLKSKTDN